MSGHLSSSAKKLVEDADRLSTLPPEIRVQILSLLPTIDAARVGVLSKLLRSTYYSLSRLSFDCCQFPETKYKLCIFVNLIDRTIVHHDESDITTLKLRLWPSFICKAPILPCWVRFAIKRRVEKLVLYGMIDEMKLPDNLFTCQTLVKLELAIHKLVCTSEAFALPNLRKLKLNYLVLAEQTSGNDLFPNLPALRKLSMFYCSLESRRDISISSENLEEFIMCCPEINDCALKLQAPCLSSFIYINHDEEKMDLDVHPSGFQFVINGRDAFVVRGSINELSPSVIKATKELFKNGFLSLSYWLIEYLSMAHDMLKQAIRCQFHCILRLKIEMWPIMDHLPVIILLASCCPNLIELNLVLKTPQRRAHQFLGEDSLVDYRTAGDFRSVLLVEIRNFEGGETELMLVRFLLANLVKLCSMSIWMGDLVGKDRSLLISEILGYEIASTSGEVKFDEWW